MSDSDSSCGVVISGFTGPQPSVKMVKRDRHREAPRHRENYPSSEDNGDSTAMMQQHASSSERKSKSDRKTETRDHSKSTTQGRRAERRATLDQYKPLPRNNSSQNFTIHKPLPRKSSLQNFAIPKSVEIDHSDRNEIIEINAADDNKSKRSSISRRKTLPPSEGSFISKQIDPHSGRTRRKTLPLPEESCISNQIDPHSGQNLDSISRGNPRAVQSSNRSEKNNNSKRSLQPRPSELIEGHRRPSSRDNIITRSSKTPRDPNIPSFLSIPANHEGADDHEGFEHDTYHRREDNMKDTSAQRTRDFSPSKNRPMESIGTTIIPSQTVAKSNPINHIEEHLSPLMIAASELDTMRNQLELFIQQMNTGHDSEDSVVEVNILSPPTPLPHSSFPEQLLKMVRLLPGNDQCCDCGKECLQENKTEETIRELTVGVDSAHIGGEGSSGTQQGEATTGGNKERLHSWASTSFGIILCNKCAYRHYNYAKKVSLGHVQGTYLVNKICTYGKERK